MVRRAARGSCRIAYGGDHAVVDVHLSSLDHAERHVDLQGADAARHDLAPDARGRIRARCGCGPL